jgi:hypothetical protein
VKLGPYAAVTGIVLTVVGAVAAIAGILTAVGWLAVSGAAVLVAGFVLFMVGIARTFRVAQRATRADEPDASPVGEGAERVGPRFGGPRADSADDLADASADDAGVSGIQRQSRAAADEDPP